MPRVSATSPASSHTVPLLSPTMAALPWVWQISVRGASSRMLIDHGGSSINRNTKAPRARTPSSNPTTASTPGAYRQPAYRGRYAARKTSTAARA